MNHLDACGNVQCIQCHRQTSRVAHSGTYPGHEEVEKTRLARQGMQLHYATLCYAMLRSSWPRSPNDRVRKPNRNCICYKTWQFDAVYGCPNTRHFLRRRLNILLRAMPHAIGSQDALEDGTIKLISSEGTEPQRTTQQSTVIRSN